MICNNCGKFIKENEKFCDSCKQEIKNNNKIKLSNILSTISLIIFIIILLLTFFL